MDRDALKQIDQDQQTVLAWWAIMEFNAGVRETFDAVLEDAVKRGGAGVVLNPETTPKLTGLDNLKPREQVAIAACLADYARKSGFTVIAHPTQRGVYVFKW